MKENNPLEDLCQICKKPKIICKGRHGGSGGGSSGSDTEAKTEEKATSKTQIKSLIKYIYTLEVMSELLTNNVLVISNQRKNGKLTLELKYHPSVHANEKAEFNKLVGAISQELNEFKNGKYSKHLKTEKDNTLSITLPSPEIYDEFVKLLGD